MIWIGREYVGSTRSVLFKRYRSGTLITPAPLRAKLEQAVHDRHP